MTERTNSIQGIKIALADGADQVFMAENKTMQAFAPNPALVRGFNRAKTGQLPTLTLDGMGDYGSKYPDGIATLTWTDYTLANDRGRKFNIDAVDIMTEEGMLSASFILSEFIRTEVVPEIDANAISKVAQAIITAQGTITSHKGKRIEYGYTPAAATILGKIVNMLNAVKERTGKEEGYHIFVNAAYRGLLENSTEVTKTKAVNGAGALTQIDARSYAINGEPVVFMPANRMYSKIDLYDGTTEGEETGGYIKDASTGKDIVALITKDGAVNSIVAHAVSKIITPEENQEADGSIIAYRAYYDTIIPTKKLDGCEILIVQNES